MSKTRKIILITLINISIVLWLTLIYSALNHKEDPALINYKSPEEVITSPKKTVPTEDMKLEDEDPGF